MRERRPDAGASRARAFAVSLLTAGLLVFAWPFVRAPPLDAPRAYLHLLGAWLVVIAGLGVLSRAIGRGEREDDDA
jgi:hypothetical protein